MEEATELEKEQTTLGQASQQVQDQCQFLPSTQIVPEITQVQPAQHLEPIGQHTSKIEGHANGVATPHSPKQVHLQAWE